MEKWIALVVAVAPMVVALIGGLALIISKKLEQKPLPAIKQGETVTVPDADDDEPWRGWLADKDRRIVELDAELKAERGVVRRLNTRIAIMREHLAIDRGWHHRNPDPSPMDPHPDYLDEVKAEDQP